MTRIVQLIRFHHDNYVKIVQYPLLKRTVAYDAKVARFREESRSSLFDIAACKCTDFSLCSCDKTKKVPIPERVFLTDQRTVRKMMIGPVDIPSTNALIKKGLRKGRELERVDKYRIEAQSSTSSLIYSPSSSAVSDAAADNNTSSSVSNNTENNDAEVEIEATGDASEPRGLTVPDVVDSSSPPRLRVFQQRRRLQNVA